MKLAFVHILAVSQWWHWPLEPGQNNSSLLQWCCNRQKNKQTNKQKKQL